MCVSCAVAEIGQGALRHTERKGSGDAEKSEILDSDCVGRARGGCSAMGGATGKNDGETSRCGRKTRGGGDGTAEILPGRMGLHGDLSERREEKRRVTQQNGGGGEIADCNNTTARGRWGV